MASSSPFTGTDHSQPSDGCAPLRLGLIGCGRIAQAAELGGAASEPSLVAITSERAGPDRAP